MEANVCKQDTNRARTSYEQRMRTHKVCIQTLHKHLQTNIQHSNRQRTFHEQLNRVHLQTFTGGQTTHKHYMNSWKRFFMNVCRWTNSAQTLHEQLEEVLYERLHVDKPHTNITWMLDGDCFASGCSMQVSTDTLELLLGKAFNVLAINIYIYLELGNSIKNNWKFEIKKYFILLEYIHNSSIIKIHIWPKTHYII